MERKNLIRLAKFIGIIILVIIIIENSIRGIGKLIENKKEKDNEEKKLELYQNSVEYKETIMLEGVIANLEELLNNNDIEKIYALLDVNYREYKFKNDIENFKEYIKKYVNSESKITFQTYEKVSGGYLCRLLSEYDDNIKSLVVLINKENDENYTIIFDNINNIQKEEKSVNLNGLECNILYTITAKKTLVYSLEFINNSKNNINYTIKEGRLRDTAYNIFLANIEESVKLELKPNESIRKDFVFYNDEVHMYPKTYFDINLKNSTGHEENINIFMEKE